MAENKIAGTPLGESISQQQFNRLLKYATEITSFLGNIGPQQHQGDHENYTLPLQTYLQQTFEAIKQASDNHSEPASYSKDKMLEAIKARQNGDLNALNEEGFTPEVKRKIAITAITLEGIHDIVLNGEPKPERESLGKDILINGEWAFRQLANTDARCEGKASKAAQIRSTIIQQATTEHQGTSQREREADLGI